MPSAATRDEYAMRLARGGFPLALARSRGGPGPLVRRLRRTVPGARPVGGGAGFASPAALAPLLSRLAAQTAQVLNMSRAGDGAGLSASTAADYIRLFESSFLVRLLPAWGKTLLAATAARPKVHVVDSGLAARLLRVAPEKLGRLDAASLQQFGHLLETFVVGEVLKQTAWMEHRPHVGHWRTHDGHEVDLVIEDGRDGSVLGIEVKAGARVHAHDRRGLRMLRDALGERFAAGVVFHTGPHSIRYRDQADDRIIALPIDRLWSDACSEGL